jgi:surface antigen
MEKFIRMRNDLVSKKIIKGLNSRNIDGYYVRTKEEALEKALELIPQGSSVSWGGAMSAQGIGLMKALHENGNYTILDRDTVKSP